ncbi:MAG TPA: hypothetical protein VHQ66_10220 [Myxococcota bacterium]|jgi:hypothetical protein|nr:hypothetical protein [Myxococcota bacterium]
MSAVLRTPTSDSTSSATVAPSATGGSAATGVEPVVATAAPSAEPGLASAPAIEPSLVNRLVGVSAAIFAVPVAVELRRAATHAQLGPTTEQQAWLLAAALALVVAFAVVLRRASGTPALRAGRVLWVVLALEAASLAAALASQSAR